jgi:hypothetical protein
VLGKLGREIPNLPSDLFDTYGLYTDNAYLKGTMILENEGYSAGISTKKIHKTTFPPNSITETEELGLVFWGGEKDENGNLKPNFFVNERGQLYAKDGYFTGIIDSSLLRAITIEGIGNQNENIAALTIKGTSDNEKGLEFMPDGSNIKFALSGEKAIFDGYEAVWIKEKSQQEDSEPCIRINNFGILNYKIENNAISQIISYIPTNISGIGLFGSPENNL